MIKTHVGLQDHFSLVQRYSEWVPVRHSLPSLSFHGLDETNYLYRISNNLDRKTRSWLQKWLLFGLPPRADSGTREVNVLKTWHRCFYLLLIFTNHPLVNSSKKAGKNISLFKQIGHKTVLYPMGLTSLFSLVSSPWILQI